MTDQIDQTTETDEIEQPSSADRRRRMFLTGAGIAGAAALVGKAGTASAADGASYTGDVTTYVNDTAGGATPGDPGGEAIVGDNTNAANGSHTIRGNTNGIGHAIAGTVPVGNANNAVAATWGKHDNGLGAGVGGVNGATDVDIAGPARGVEGIVIEGTNGSHAVFGLTNGNGHSIAGDTPADAGADADTPNTVAATWGRHAGLGAGIGGVNVAPVEELAGAARGVEGAVTSPTNGSHAVFGATNGAGHSIAGDTPEMVPDAPGSTTMVPNPNVQAATWGRHAGLGAGIGGINTGNGYGGEFIGGKSHVRLIPVADSAGAPTDDDHAVGELYADSEGGLFYNTADGSNWERINVAVAAGANVLFDDSQRAFDSRSGEATNTDQGRLTDGQTIEIDLKEFTDFEAGFQGAMLNVTLVNPDTSFGGFVTVFNGDTADADRPSTSSVNWDEQTSEIANAVTVKASESGTIKVYAVRSTDVVVDVIGYFS